MKNFKLPVDVSLCMKCDFSHEFILRKRNIMMRYRKQQSQEIQNQTEFPLNFCENFELAKVFVWYF